MQERSYLKLLSLLALVTFMLHAPTQAAVLYSSDENQATVPGIGPLEYTGGGSIGEQFIVNQPITVNSINAWLSASQFVSASDLTMSINSDDGGSPGMAEYLSQPASSLSTDYADSTFNFSGAGAALQPGTYWAVINSTSFFPFGLGQTADFPLPSNSLVSSGNYHEINGSIYPGGAGMIAIYGSEGVPEPASAVIVGIAALGGLTRRRRTA